MSQATPKISADASSAKTLATPEVEVQPVNSTVVLTWKPVDDADGYFVFRYGPNTDAKELLGIGPKEASGYVDRSPPRTPARYVVQAFKCSEYSSPQQAPGTASSNGSKPGASSLDVSFTHDKL
jgi:hypothetical protein